MVYTVEHCDRGHNVRDSSIRLSDTLVNCIRTAEDIVILFSRPGSRIILFFSNLSADTQPLERGRKIQGIGKFCDF